MVEETHCCTLVLFVGLIVALALFLSSLFFVFLLLLLLFSTRFRNRLRWGFIRGITDKIQCFVFIVVVTLFVKFSSQPSCVQVRGPCLIKLSHSCHISPTEIQWVTADPPEQTACIDTGTVRKMAVSIRKIPVGCLKGGQGEHTRVPSAVVNAVVLGVGYASTPSCCGFFCFVLFYFAAGRLV